MAVVINFIHVDVSVKVRECCLLPSFFQGMDERLPSLYRK